MFAQTYKFSRNHWRIQGAKHPTIFFSFCKKQISVQIDVIMQKGDQLHGGFPDPLTRGSTLGPQSPVIVSCSPCAPKP